MKSCRCDGDLCCRDVVATSHRVVVGRAMYVGMNGHMGTANCGVAVMSVNLTELSGGLLRKANDCNGLGTPYEGKVGDINMWCEQWGLFNAAHSMWG